MQVRDRRRLVLRLVFISAVAVACILWVSRGAADRRILSTETGPLPPLYRRRRFTTPRPAHSASPSNQTHALQWQLSANNTTALHRHLAILQRHVGAAWPGSGAPIFMQPGPIRSGGESAVSTLVGCEGELTSELTPRELDLQQQRRCALQAAGGQPEGGYLAACLAVKGTPGTVLSRLQLFGRCSVCCNVSTLSRALTA